MRGALPWPRARSADFFGQALALGLELLLGLVDVVGNLELGLADGLLSALARFLHKPPALFQRLLAAGFLLLIDFGARLAQRVLVLAHLLVGSVEEFFRLLAGAFGGGVALGQRPLQRLPQTPAQEEKQEEKDEDRGGRAQEEVAKLRENVHLRVRESPACDTPPTSVQLPQTQKRELFVTQREMRVKASALPGQQVAAAQMRC
jgi:hypothetical protein